MKKRLLCVLLAAVLLLGSLTGCGDGRKDTTASADPSEDVTASASPSESSGDSDAIMRLLYTEGTVSVFDGNGNAVTLLDNLVLYSGYRVSTQSASYAVVEMYDVEYSKEVMLDQNSEIYIEKEGKALDIELKSGSLFFSVIEPLADDETMDIRTSTMLVSIQRDCGKVHGWVEERSGLSRVYIRGEGSVECSAEGQTVQVSAWEYAELTADRNLAMESFTKSDIPAFVRYYLFDLWLHPIAEYEVPSVLGRTVEELENDKSILGDFVLQVDSTVFSDDYEAGQVCEQIPEAGAMVREGEMVITVKISVGAEEKLYMPSVIGWDAREALDKLQDEMEFVVNVQYEFSDTVTEGYVTRFSPTEGTPVEKGGTVTIWVSKGPEVRKATVPNLIGVTLEDAERLITGAGLSLGNVEEFYSDEYAAGLVIRQSIDPFEAVDRGSVIDLWVSKGTP